MSGEMSALTCTIDVAGPDIAEKLTVCLADLFPVSDVDDEHPGAHHVFQACARVAQSCLDILQSLNRLGVGIAHSDDFAVRPVAVVPAT